MVSAKGWYRWSLRINDQGQGGRAGTDITSPIRGRSREVIHTIDQGRQRELPGAIGGHGRLSQLHILMEEGNCSTRFPSAPEHRRIHSCYAIEGTVASVIGSG